MRWMAVESLSSSPRDLGSIAKEMAGSASFTPGYWMGALLSPSVSPVRVSFSLATAPMSPACSSGTGTWFLPCMIETCASFSLLLRVKFCTVASFLSTPDKTLK